MHMRKTKVGQLEKEDQRSPSTRRYKSGPMWIPAGCVNVGGSHRRARIMRRAVNKHSKQHHCQKKQRIEVSQ